MDADTRADVMKRLAYIDGHIAGIKRMVEQDTYCVDVMKQTYAVRRALDKLEAKMLDGHLRHCVVEAIESGRADPVLDELVEIYALAGR
ncbi:MAG: metal-sensitive transcriptional regulator [Chloroflexi bacterium]|nr:metal-sensitive transcriptional regulator [Chloroflexota bacterium]